MTPADAPGPLRARCLALPEVSERLSHGSPTWFVRGKKTFVSWVDRHHGDPRPAFWCASGAHERDELVAEDPERFFVPPYVGHRGWLGVHTDRDVDWDEVGELVTDAYRRVAPKTLVARLPDRPD